LRRMQLTGINPTLNASYLRPKRPITDANGYEATSQKRLPRSFPRALKTRRLGPPDAPYI
jgi:hypothetical protein